MIRHTILGSHHGQTDERLYITEQGEIAAYIDYSVYQDKPSIRMIESIVKRKGYARALVLDLQHRFPDTEIDWGMLTDEGAALKRSLTFRAVTDPALKAKTDLLVRIKEKLADLEARATPELVKEMGEHWNRLYDMERRLEYELEHATVTKHIIVG